MYVYEFLFRGRHPSENMASAYHVRLADMVEQFGEQRIVESTILTMDGARAQGFDLPEIIADINSQALHSIDMQRARIEELEIEVAELRKRLGE